MSWIKKVLNIFKSEEKDYVLEEKTVERKPKEIKVGKKKKTTKKKTTKPKAKKKGMNFTQWIQKGRMPNVVHKHMIIRAEVNEQLITPT